MRISDCIILIAMFFAVSFKAYGQGVPAVYEKYKSAQTVRVIEDGREHVAPTDPVALSKKAFLLQELSLVKTDAVIPTDYRRLIDYAIGRKNEPQEKAVPELIGKIEQKDVIEAQLFKAYFKLADVGKDDLDQTKAYNELENSILQPKWEHRYLGQLLLSVLHLKRHDVLKGLETANISLDSVPSGIERQARYEKLYDIYSVINNGFILDKSFDQALVTTSRMLNLSEKAGVSPDAFSISNNLAVLYSYRNEFDVSIKILKTAEPYMELARPDQKVAFNYSVGNFLNQNKDYESALLYLDEALRLNPPKYYLPYIYSQLAISYAETGSLLEARELLGEIKTVSTHAQSEGLLEDAILRLNYALAEKEGDYKSAHSYLKEWSEHRVEKLNREVFSNRQEAALKLSVSSRVAQERLLSLENETSLKDTIIEREKRIRYSLSVIGVLIIMLSLMLFFGLLKLRRSNIEMSIARDRAVEGERAKSAFLAMMSHEVRTPLNAIIPLSEQLILKSKNPMDKNLLKTIKSSGEALFFMMENIILMTTEDKVQSDYFVELDIHELVKQSLKTHHAELNKKSLQVTARSKRASLILPGNKRMVSVIIANILSNAVKFTNSGKINILYTGTPSEMEICVTDTGTGFDVGGLSTLLKPFVQDDNTISRKYGGAGIGLAATHKLVQKLGGKMDFESEIGKGTTVVIRLPIDQEYEMTHAA